MTNTSGFEELVRAVRLLFEGEDQCMGIRNAEIFDTESSNPRANIEMMGIHAIADNWVDRLVAERLQANDRQHHLIRDGDEEIILGMIEAAGEVNPATFDTLYHSIASALGLLEAGILAAGAGDGFVGFGQLFQALVQTAIEEAVIPLEILVRERAVEATPFRNIIFQRSMTPEAWQSLSYHLVQMLGATGATGDAAHAALCARVAQATHEYYAARLKEIWPRYHG